MEKTKVPTKRIYQLAVEQAFQNWKRAYNSLCDEPKDSTLISRERTSLEEYIDMLKAKEDFERENQ